MAIMNSPESVLSAISERVREARLRVNLTQVGLAKRAGVSYGSIKKFERDGQISLQSLLKIAVVLDALGDFECLFKSEPSDYRSLSDLLKEDKKKKRGRIS